jgi:flagellin-specific chaperone FliS
VGVTFSSLLDRLLDALRAADAALDRQAPDAARDALDEAFGSLGALYATLDSSRHPELSSCMQFVFDECLQAIGAASLTRRERLVSTIALLHQVRTAHRPLLKLGLELG